MVLTLQEKEEENTSGTKGGVTPEVDKCFLLEMEDVCPLRYAAHLPAAVLMSDTKTFVLGVACLVLSN